MNTPLASIALCACLLCVGGCDKSPATPPTPAIDKTAPVETGVTSGTVTHASVPSAESVFSPTNATPASAAQGRSNSTLSAAQESNAMPMPGQNNDHSAPLAPARRASSP